MALGARRALSGLVLAFAALGAACGAFGSDGPGDQPAPATGGDAATDAPAACKPAGPYNQAGCACAVEAAVQNCANGRGELGKTPCTVGKQLCKAGSWTPCDGASQPAATDDCFDDADNDCDGVVDNKCLGATDTPLCEGKAAGDFYVVLDKPTGYSTAAGEMVHFFVFAQTKITRVHLDRVGGGYCAGGSGGGREVSPGAACAADGWFAYRRSIKITDPLFNLPTTKIDVQINGQDTPACTNPARKLSIDVIKK